MIDPELHEVTSGTRNHGERIVERELFGGEPLLVGETLLVWRAPG